MAALGETQGVDLWYFKTTDGRSLKAALDFLAPYADSSEKWPYEQIADLNKSKLKSLLSQGYRVYGDERYRDLMAKID